MKNSTKKIFLGIIFLFLLFASCLAFANAPDAHAASWWTKQYGASELGKPFGGVTDPRIIVVHIIKAFLEFIGIIFLILIIAAGFKYMTAQGNEENIKQAVNQIKRAVIGLVIIMAAFSITSFLTDCILDITVGETVWMCQGDK